jgi:uncharacterized protein (TIGR00661 family)
LRILFTAQPAYSHLVPLVLPVAVLARRAGHEVAVATGTEVAEHVEEAGVTGLVLPNLVSIKDLVGNPALAKDIGFELPDATLGSGTMVVTPQMFAHNFVGVLGSRFARDLIDVLGDWKPDIVLRESTEFGGYLVAERLGVPHGALDIAPTAPFGHPALLGHLNQQRRLLDLAPVRDPWHPMRMFRASVTLEIFYPPENRLATARYYRAQIESSQPAVAELPSGQPLVLASLGSHYPRILSSGPSILDTIIGALGELPVTGVVVLGSDYDPDRWQGARAENVVLKSSVQQKELLEACEVFITHGGFNGICEALAAGVPMVALPMTTEQSDNAARVAQLGVSISLNLEEITPRSLRSAVDRVLTVDAFRNRARVLRRQVLALPPLSQIVEDAASCLTAGQSG